MKIKWEFEGLIKCRRCDLQFLPLKEFFEDLNPHELQNKKIELKAVCPACDCKNRVDFELEKVTRELIKTYTLRC